MRDGFKVIDADRHVLEPSDLFANMPALSSANRFQVQRISSGSDFEH